MKTLATSARLLTLICASATACSSSAPATDSKAAPDGTRDAGPGAEARASLEGHGDQARPSESGFDPANPGIYFSLVLAVTDTMMPSAMTAGLFMKTAREDFDPEEPSAVPLESCVVDQPSNPTPKCTSNDQCAPEQECKPDTDDGGPIPGSDHCQTPRGPLDVGPFTVTGFVSGPLTYVSNSSQKGGYLPEGGNGQIPIESIAYGITYTIAGAGDQSQGLGAFTGSLTFPAEFKLTAPAVVKNGIGLTVVPVSTSQDLTLSWTGAKPDEEVTIMLATPLAQASISCRAKDDGSFTIPAAMVQAAKLGDFDLWNMMTIERHRKGTASGPGLTFAAVQGSQFIYFNVQKVP